MATKPTLTFYTNIPAPYQLSFFKALSVYFKLIVIYYSIEQNGNKWSLDRDAKYDVSVLKNNFIANIVQKRIPDFHFSWGIIKKIFSDESDYIIVGGGYWIPNAAFALIGSKLRRKKVYYFSEALYEVNNRSKYWVKRLFLQILNMSCDGILCTGKKAVESFESFRVKPPKYIVPYNTDIDFFNKLDGEKRTGFLNFYKNNVEVILLTSGFLIHRKGMDILIRAVKEIKYNYKLIILGDGEKKDELIEMCGGDDRILFVGFQKLEDIPYFYSIADIFILTSRYDGWGVVINEAIAANVPIISSNKVGAAIELITSDEDGIICESEDVNAFKQAIELLITEREKRETIKRNAGKLISKISSDQNAKYVAQIFKKQFI